MTTVKKTHWLRNTLIVLIICGILGTVLAAFLFNDGTIRTAATARIEFSFDGAADGIAPNGNRFDMNGILKDEVLNKALETAGMAERYTAEQIRGNIVVTGVYPEDIVKQMMDYDSVLDFKSSRTMTVSRYHATQYTVALFQDFDRKISKKDLETLLKAVMESFREYFAREYATVTETRSSYDLEQFDYPQQLTIIRSEIEESAAFAQEMYEKEPSIRCNGYAFSDIAVRLNNLIEGEISNLSAEITMNALTRDTARLVTQYQYEIQTMNHELEKQKERLAKVDALLAAYEKNEIIYLSTSDSLTKIDGNSSETYDSLVAERKSVADGITDINTQITEYRLMLDDLLKDTTDAPVAQEAVQTAETGDGTEATETEIMSQEEIQKAAETAEQAARQQIARLEKSIETLENKRLAIMKDFEDLLNTYNGQELNELTVSVYGYDYEAPKIFSGAFAKQVVKTAGPICAVGFMACLVLIIRSRRKEEKQSA